MNTKTETPRTDSAWHPVRIAEHGVASVMEEMKTLERELTQWREVAELLAQVVFNAMPSWPAEYSRGDGYPCAEITIGDHKAMVKSLAAYDALTKLSDGGKG